MRVRIQSAQIKNIRNVEYGEIKFPHSEDPFTLSSDVVGIYGQNGSGKTTFIYALEILQRILSGSPISEWLGGCVSYGAEQSTLSFELSVEDEQTRRFRVLYTVEFGSDYLKESIKASLLENQVWSRLNEILCSDSRDNERILTPETKKSEFFGKNSKTLNELSVGKLLCAKERRSFLFSTELIEIMSEKSGDTPWLSMLKALRHFGQADLFVITNRNTGLISIDAALPFHFRTSFAFGEFALPLDRPITLPQEVYTLIEQVISTINVVLREIIPGMDLGIKNLGSELTKDGKNGVRVQMVRNRKDERTGQAIPLPLKYESEGIKKIISFLHLFISAYNNPGITLAIDELDSGIYEYLLGELLKIMQISGKGQLIFTSHNLHPLEMLDSDCIVFTTTNPKRRYVRAAKIKPSNNLRLCYYRTITLGSDSGEELYNETNSIEIAHAMRKIGAISRKERRTTNG